MGNPVFYLTLSLRLFFKETWVDCGSLNLAALLAGVRTAVTGCLAVGMLLQSRPQPPHTSQLVQHNNFGLPEEEDGFPLKIILIELFILKSL